MRDEKLKLQGEFLENNVNFIFNTIQHVSSYNAFEDRKNMYNKLKRIKFLVKEALKQIDDFEDKHGTKAMPERIKTYE